MDNLFKKNSKVVTMVETESSCQKESRKKIWTAPHVHELDNKHTSGSKTGGIGEQGASTGNS